MLSAIVLRRTAEVQRAQTLRDLRELRGTLQDKPDSVKRLDTFNDEVTKLRRGAFAELAQQPLLGAILLQVSGLGGVAILERLATSPFSG
jgi:hypothetical protein